MGTAVKIQQPQLQSHCILMNSFFSSKIRTLCTNPFALNGRARIIRAAAATSKASEAAHLKQNWLDSLTSPPLHDINGNLTTNADDSQWVLGIDPDLSGALAVLKTDQTGCSAQDDSRRIASTLFPSLSSQLKRKKDHGKAEAVLIAAYAKGLKSDLPHLSDELVPQNCQVVMATQLLQKES